MLRGLQYAILNQKMNTQNFNCHSFLDNNTISLLEISVKDNTTAAPTLSFYWLLINKQSLKVTRLQLKSRDDSDSIQERFFDLGYLKYDASTGVFISQHSNELHPLENTSCHHVPDPLLQAVENYLSMR